MTESKTSESGTAKAKGFWSDFYATPHFWLKVISLTTIVGLAIFGLYKIVTSALHYFNEPLSYFDPERLGQLGDFLGGTLNPIFGFATVCLLLWSVFIQRQELSLTRDELKKSAIALENQVKLATIEYNRKQLDDLLNTKKKEYSDLRNKSFKPISISEIINVSELKTYVFSNLEALIKSQSIGSPTLEKLTEKQIEDVFEPKVISNEIIDRRNVFFNFKILTLDLIKIQIELLKITNINEIKKQLRCDATEKARDMQKIHLLSHNELRELILNIAAENIDEIQ